MTRRQIASELLLRLSLSTVQDVFQLRRCGREVAAALELEDADRSRVATALSEVGRELVAAGVTATADFRLVATPVPTLSVELTWQPVGALEQLTYGGFAAASRLVDTATRTEDRKAAFVLTKRLPATTTLHAGAAAGLRVRLAALAPTDAVDELRAQNQELLATLEALKAKQDELMRLNAELVETNSGVVALYTELSTELEETNRGVVALYAELDDKSEQLKQASAAKTRFWSSVSHELRSPMNSVLGLARLLLAPDGDPLTDEQRHQIELISATGSTLLSLVNELLDVAKAESGRLEPNIVPVDLAVLFGQLRGTLRPAVPSPDVTLIVEDPGPVPPFATDEVMLARILRNLVSNALKFTERGEVRIVFRAEGDHSVFVVSDTGIGIPLDQQEQVFEEFHQVRGPLQVRSGGTGLGLPYARRLAGILGGTLELTSVPGQGTTVTVRLPRLEMPGGTSARWGTVLVVDDELGWRKILCGLVTDLADRVIEAPDGDTALALAAAERPDLIILDVRMPAPDGQAVLASLRDDPSLRTVPVILVSSSAPAVPDHSAGEPGTVFLSKTELSRETIAAAAMAAATGTGTAADD